MLDSDKGWSRRAALRRLFAGVALVASSGRAKVSADAFEPNAPIVSTRSGMLKGNTRAGVDVFRGIPYGGPTEGNNRFLPPTPPPVWDGVLDALDCGPPCVQINTDLPAWVDPRPASENCLVLNVWSPRREHSRLLPVMVWVHGGAYLSGSGGLALYDGGKLARRGDVVVVTVNHRLNAFGYLYLGGLNSRYPDSGNIGQLDLVAALHWVRGNVDSFRGNPNNVTLFGESGGGGKISALCGMPAAKGLFHKAIIESGSLWDTHTTQEATHVAQACLAELSISVKDVDRLNEVPAQDLAAAGQAVVTRLQDPLAFRPVVDGRSIRENLWESKAPELAASIPMMIGTNRDEAVYFIDDPIHEPVNDDDLRDRIIKGCPGVNLSSEQVCILIRWYRDHRSGHSRLELLVQIATDSWMWRNALIQAERKVRQGATRVFMYEFAWKTPCFGRIWSPHGSEIPFVFGNLDYNYAWDKADTPLLRAAADATGSRYQLADIMMSQWAAFAHTGNPSTASAPWPGYELDRRATMILGARCHVETDPRSSQRELLTRVLR